MQIATVRFAFCSLLMLVQSVAVPATASATTASGVAATTTAALQDRFCYSYIFRNYTAEDANDLHIGFEDPGGSGAVSDVYLGPDNPFISVTLSSSTNPSGTAQTAIAYSNGKVSPGEAARISFCNRVSKMRSVPSWTLPSLNCRLNWPRGWRCSPPSATPPPNSFFADQPNNR